MDDIKFNSKIDPVIPSKVFNVLDPNCKLMLLELFRLSQPIITSGKVDENGYFTFPMKLLCSATGFCRNKAKAVLSTLHSNHIIEVVSCGCSNGTNGKGSETNKYRFVTEIINDYCSKPFVKETTIKTEKYNVKGYKLSYMVNFNNDHNKKDHQYNMVVVDKDHHKTMVANNNWHHNDMVNFNNDHHKNMVNFNNNHHKKDHQETENYGGHSLYHNNIPVYTIDNNNILYNNTSIPEEEEKRKKEKIYKKEKEKKEEVLVEALPQSADKPLTQDDLSETEKDFFKDNPELKSVFTDNGNISYTGSVPPVKITIDRVKNYDGKRPGYDVKYFIGPVPDVISDKTEFDDYMNATLYQLRGVTNWTDYKLYEERLMKIYQAGEKSYTDEWMTVHGTTVMKYQFKSLCEKYQNVLTRLYRYFMIKYSNLPYNGIDEMYQLLNIKPISVDEYQQRLKKARENNTSRKDDVNWQPWSFNGNTYEDEQYLSDEELDEISKAEEYNNSTVMDNIQVSDLRGFDNL